MLGWPGLARPVRGLSHAQCLERVVGLSNRIAKNARLVAAIAAEQEQVRRGMRRTTAVATMATRHLAHRGVDLIRSSGDTIPNRWAEFREIRESKQRIGIAAYGHPAGRPRATGVERLRSREHGLRPVGRRRARTNGLIFSVGIARFGAILK